MIRNRKEGKMKQKWSITELQKTWHLVTKLHNGQKYGGQEEGEQVAYINHIGSVVFEILAAINEAEAINVDLAIKCAMLHDTIEDTEASYKIIQEKFGQTVADGVLALTKNEALADKRAMMVDSLNRIKQQPKEVWAVKMADRICNLYAPPFYWTNDKKSKYLVEAKLIYDELKEGNKYLANRLKKKIENYRKYLD